MVSEFYETASASLEAWYLFPVPRFGVLAPRTPLGQWERPQPLPSSRISSLAWTVDSLQPVPLTQGGLNRRPFKIQEARHFPPWMVRIGIFPAISINKDVNIITDPSPPGQSGKRRIPRISSIRLQPLPTPWGAQDVKNTGYWPQITGMHTKGMISVSPDSRIFPYKAKCYIISLGYLVFFNSQKYFWCSDCALSRIWLCDPVGCSPPGSSVHGISQARTLERGAISSSSGPSWFRDRIRFFCVLYINRWVLYHCATWEDPPALCCKLLYNLASPPTSWEQFSQGYLRCCLLGLKS